MTDHDFVCIKSATVAQKNAGTIISMIEAGGQNIIAIKNLKLTAEQASEFYDVHKEKSFFPELVEYTTSGPIFVLALEGENAIKRWRELMGATNSTEAAEGTIGKLYGKSLSHNASHGSDVPETAAVEVACFFDEKDVVS